MPRLKSAATLSASVQFAISSSRTTTDRSKPSAIGWFVRFATEGSCRPGAGARHRPLCDKPSQTCPSIGSPQHQCWRPSAGLISRCKARQTRSRPAHLHGYPYLNTRQCLTCLGLGSKCKVQATPPHESAQSNGWRRSSCFRSAIARGRFVGGSAQPTLATSIALAKRCSTVGSRAQMLGKYR